MLECQQKKLRRQTISARIAARARRRNDAVTGDQDGDRVVRHRRANRTRTAPSCRRQFGVGAGLPGRDFAQSLPDATAIFGAEGGERQGEAVALAVKIILQLLTCFEQQRRLTLVAPPPPIERYNRAVVFRDGEVTDRCVQRELRQEIFQMKRGSPGADASATARFCQAADTQGRGCFGGFVGDMQ